MLLLLLQTSNHRDFRTKVFPQDREQYPVASGPQPKSRARDLGPSNAQRTAEIRDEFGTAWSHGTREPPESRVMHLWRPAKKLALVRRPMRTVIQRRRQPLKAYNKSAHACAWGCAPQMHGMRWNLPFTNLALDMG
jgi:hypothetical protein